MASGIYLLHDATKAGNRERLLELIREGYDLNIKDDILGYAALHHALGNEDIAKTLISAGAEVDIQDDSGQTLLHRASGQDNGLNLVKLLVQNDASLSLKDSEGKIALHFAFAYGEKETAKYLLAHGSETSIKTNLGQSILHLAAARGKIGLLRIAFRFYSNVNEQDANGRTPLHLLSMKGYAAESNEWLGSDFFDSPYLERENRERVIAAKFLLRHGADKQLRDNLGLRPIDYAIKNDLANIVEIIR